MVYPPIVVSPPEHQGSVLGHDAPGQSCLGTLNVLAIGAHIAEAQAALDALRAPKYRDYLAELHHLSEFNPYRPYSKSTREQLQNDEPLFAKDKLDRVWVEHRTFGFGELLEQKLTANGSVVAVVKYGDIERTLVIEPRYWASPLIVVECEVDAPTPPVLLRRSVVTCAPAGRIVDYLEEKKETSTKNAAHGHSKLQRADYERQLLADNAAYAARDLKAYLEALPFIVAARKCPGLILATYMETEFINRIYQIDLAIENVLDEGRSIKDVIRDFGVGWQRVIAIKHRSLFGPSKEGSRKQMSPSRRKRHYVRHGKTKREQLTFVRQQDSNLATESCL